LLKKKQTQIGIPISYGLWYLLVPENKKRKSKTENELVYLADSSKLFRYLKRIKRNYASQYKLLVQKINKKSISK